MGFSTPAAEGYVEGWKVNVFRHTSCSTIVIKRDLVPDEQLMGAEETQVLIDGTTKANTSCHHRYGHQI